jgi:hypothetical protein
MPARSTRLAKVVTPGLDPGVHRFEKEIWMAGSSPAMTLCG